MLDNKWFLRFVRGLVERSSGELTCRGRKIFGFLLDKGLTFPDFYVKCKSSVVDRQP